VRIVHSVQSGTSGLQPRLVRLADVDPESVQWLWEPYIPLGKITLLEGNPGVGKTFLALGLAAAVSRGWPLPRADGSSGKPSTPSTVLYLTAEDGLADTLRPRVERAGADLERLFVLDGLRSTRGRRRAFNLREHMLQLEQVLTELHPCVMILDPLHGYLGPGTDMYRANEVRPILEDLGRLAQGFDCAVVGIRHLRKQGSDQAVHRGAGSVDFSAVARSLLLVGEDRTRPGTRVVAHTKSNLAPLGGSLAFEIDSGGLRWAGASDLRSDDLLVPTELPIERGDLDRAAAFLETELAEGPVRNREIRLRARDEGISEATLKRAKARLRVRSVKRGQGHWEWQLPGIRGAEEAQGAQHPDSAVVEPL
jgi:hypothetical protein